MTKALDARADAGKVESYTQSMEQITIALRLGTDVRLAGKKKQHPATATAATAAGAHGIILPSPNTIDPGQSSTLTWQHHERDRRQHRRIGASVEPSGSQQVTAQPSRPLTI